MGESMIGEMRFQVLCSIWLAVKERDEISLIDSGLAVQQTNWEGVASGQHYVVFLHKGEIFICFEWQEHSGNTCAGRKEALDDSQSAA